MGDFSIGLLPDLRAGGFIMGEPVGEVVVLIGVKRMGDLFARRRAME
jgi:hypothetical protein